MTDEKAAPPTYIDGLRAAYRLCVAKPTAFAFSPAAEIQELIDVEEKRLAVLAKRRADIQRRIDPRRF